MCAGARGTRNWCVYVMMGVGEEEHVKVNDLWRSNTLNMGKGVRTVLTRKSLGKTNVVLWYVFKVPNLMFSFV